MTNSIQAEVVPEMAMTVHEAPPPPSLFGTSDPGLVVQKAVLVANTLKGIIKQQKLISTISGKEYPRCEAWTLLGTMLGVFPVLVWTRKLDNGWEARVEARTRDGAVVGAAEAECLNTERNWNNRDDFALRSMAQTRATAKCLRMPLGFVMTLAGLEATPAEEMGHEPSRNAPTTHSKHSTPTQTPTKPPQTAPAPFPTVEQREKMIKELKAEPGGTNRDLVTEYFRKAGALLPTENIEDLGLCFVPSMASQMRALGSALAAFGNGERAELAFPTHFEPEKKSTKKAPKQEELPTSAKVNTDGVRSWEDFPVPFGKSAGMRLGDVPKKSLFGFWANFEVKTEYQGLDGMAKPLSKEKIAKDQTFRDMLDLAGEYYEFKKPEEDEVPF